MKIILTLFGLCFFLIQTKAQSVVDTFYYTGITDTFLIEPCMDSVTSEVIAGSGEDANTAEAGTYFIVVTLDGEQRTEKFVKR